MLRKINNLLDCKSKEEFDKKFIRTSKKELYACAIELLSEIKDLEYQVQDFERQLNQANEGIDEFILRVNTREDALREKDKEIERLCKIIEPSFNKEKLLEAQVQKLNEIKKEAYANI